MFTTLLSRVLAVLAYSATALVWLLGADHLAPIIGSTLVSIIFVALTTAILGSIVWHQARAGFKADKNSEFVLNELPSGLAIIDSLGVIQSANAAFFQMFRTSQTDAVYHAFDALAGAQSGTKSGRSWLPRQGEITGTLTVHGNGDAWGELFIRVVRFQDGTRHPGWIVTSLDVTEVEQMRRARAVHLKAMDVTADGIAIVDARSADNPLLYVNEAFQHIAGYPREEMIGRNCRFLQGSARDQPGIAVIRRALADRKPISATLRNYRKTGEMFWNEMRMAPVLDAAGILTHYVGTMRDVTELRRVTSELERCALCDTLTPLANRAGFRKGLDALMTSTAPTVVVAKVNVAGFHGINTTFGYRVGDALLVQIAGRLKALPSSLAARVDGDKFMIAFSTDADHDVAATIQALSAALLPNFILPGVSLRVFFQVGYSLDSVGEGASKVMRDAAAALYEARRKSELAPLRYSTELDREISRRMRLTGDLQQAVAENELVIAYQPQVELSTGRVIGAEGLVRWRHPTFGLQTPERFIPIAEQTGLIVPIGEFVLREVGRFAAAINHGMTNPYRFSVNVSQMQFRQADLPALIERVLGETGAEPGWITIELTESLLADQSVGLIRDLQRLRALGLGLSIDDFGTGYSSLQYLHSFPITEIKIDRIFLKEIRYNRSKLAVVEAVLGLGRAMDVNVVAEGIETKEELHLLRDIGCVFGQGYYFGASVSGDHFAKQW